MKHTHAHTHPHTRMCALQVVLRDVHYQIYFGNGFVKYAGIYMIKRSVVIYLSFQLHLPVIRHWVHSIMKVVILLSIQTQNVEFVFILGISDDV